MFFGKIDCKARFAFEFTRVDCSFSFSQFPAEMILLKMDTDRHCLNNYRVILKTKTFTFLRGDTLI